MNQPTPLAFPTPAAPLERSPPSAWAARTPSAAEVSDWVQALAFGAATYLGRSATQPEVNGWVTAFENGYRNEDVVPGFVGSAEDYYHNGDTPNDWLDSAFEAIFGRQPTAHEADLWLSRL